MLHVIYTLLRSGHLSVGVGDSSWRSEEIVKRSRIAPLNLIVIMIIMIMMMIISTDLPSSETATIGYTFYKVVLIPCEPPPPESREGDDKKIAGARLVHT